ncbi:MAG: hypothetical protein C5B48_03855 [Candidatus Rokuibacteriota bacterium]|nr:MAG: hypothetical protein C5B48_03855 [Candidatus Rokubacteria bacterium]
MGPAGPDYRTFLSSFAFDPIEPGVRLGRDGRFTIPRKDGSAATVIEIPGAPVDVVNARLDADLSRLLRPLCDVPRMGTIALGAIMNHGVRRLRADEAFVNVGVWNGFSFLCGLRGNAERLCVGVDNFSEFEGPRDAFLERFEQSKGPAHAFYDMDYQDYFARQHHSPIGLYFYDGDHAYEHQLRGLQTAEPFFTDDCVVVVDDTNWEEPRQATLDFMVQSDRDYALLLDARTADQVHPSFWNGVIVFQATGGKRSDASSNDEQQSRAALPSNPIDFTSRSTLVSMVICNTADDVDALESVIEASRRQAWPNLEIVVADASGDPAVQDALDRLGTDAVSVRVGDGQSPARAGLEASRGSHVAFLDSCSKVEDDGLEMGLALPQLSRFNLGPPAGDRARRIDRALAAAREVASLIPPDASFVLAGKKISIPQSIASERCALLFDRGARMETLDAAGAVGRIEQLRSDGAAYAVFLPDVFQWLADRPDLERALRDRGRTLAHSDDVRIYAL